MGAYVLLLKELEDDDKVIYRFGPNENSMGKIQLNKITRKFTEIEPIPDSGISTKFYFDRAAQRLSICFVRENSVFPDRTTFES